MKKLYTGIVAAVFIVGLVGCSAETVPPSGSANTASPTAIAVDEAAASASAELEAAAEAEASASAAAASIKDEEAAAKTAEAEKKAAAAEQKKKKEAEKQRIAKAKPMSSRALARLVKKPDAAEGEIAVLYGEITQFDAATGACIFRANIAHAKMSSSWKYEHNAIFVGGDGISDCPKLDEFVADDEVKIVATSMGSYSYDTQVGGNTTVPKFKVEKVSLLK